MLAIITIFAASTLTALIWLGVTAIVSPWLWTTYGQTCRYLLSPDFARASLHWLN